MEQFVRILPLLVLAALASCGGGGYGGGGDTPPSPGGVWNGTDSVTGEAVTGLIDESGDTRFIRSDSTQYVGVATTSSSSFSVNLDGYPQFGATYPDGSTHESGTVSGTIKSRASITGNTHFTTDKGSPSGGTISLTFNQLYLQPSSLAAIAGNYTTTAGTVVSIDANGTLFSQDATTGCVVNGNVTIINASYDLYGIQATYSSCTAGSAPLNGVTFKGLATLDTTAKPVQILAGLTGSSSAGATYSLIYTLNHT